MTISMLCLSFPRCLSSLRTRPVLYSLLLPQNLAPYLARSRYLINNSGKRGHTEGEARAWQELSAARGMGLCRAAFVLCTWGAQLLWLAPLNRYPCKWRGWSWHSFYPLVQIRLNLRYSQKCSVNNSQSTNAYKIMKKLKMWEYLLCVRCRVLYILH